MKLGLTQHLRAEQRLVQSPQMIQAMQILQCPMAELLDRVDQELQENLFLELKEDRDDSGESRNADGDGADSSRSDEQRADEQREDERGADEQGADESGSDQNESEAQELWSELEQLESRVDGRSRAPRGSDEDAERRFEALYNAPDHGVSLADYLLEQVRIMDIDDTLFRVVEHIVFSLNQDGRLEDNAEQIADVLLVPIPLAQKAIDLVRDLDPAGVGAVDLRDCLLMQLDRMSYVRPLTHDIIENHLDDLAMNKLPKIAKETGASIEDIKESWSFIRDNLKPHPGAAYSDPRNSTVSPDVIVEEVDGEFEVRTLRGAVPELAISATYKQLLKEARNDPKVHEYLRRKIEAAKSFIEAVHQRQNTIQRIANEIVGRQEDFLREGVQALKPMKMQEVADAVGVHISTVSRAISGKYIQTPQGIFEIKRFFSGGTVTDSGKMVSQQAIKDTLSHIVAAEDKNAPLSDDQLVEALAREGIHIARRTVTKYRKALDIASSSRRREF